MTATLLAMVASGCIKECKEQDLEVILPLSVVFSNKERLLSDASRNLNEFVEDQTVKLSHLGVCNENLRSGCWFTTADLESGYWQIPLHPSMYKYVGICWTINGKKRYFHWLVLFLGLKSAVHAFTKILRPHIKFCAQLGVCLVLFIDDQRVVADTYEKCLLHTCLAHLSLRMAGWIIKKGKGILFPVQYGCFLGLDHDMINLKYFIPKEKLEKIIIFGKWLANQRRVQLRQIASFYGKISACRLAIGPLTSLLCRYGQIEMAIHTKNDKLAWNKWISLPQNVKEEIEFLCFELPKINGYPIKVSSSFVPQRTFVSDASSTGLAGAEVLCGNTLEHKPHSGPCILSPIIQRAFSLAETESSSTVRELASLIDLYIKNANQFKNQRILHYCDNANVEKILTKGSNKIHLQTIAMAIFKSCRKNNIHLCPKWISREDPRVLGVDYLSREVDFSDWGLTNFYFDNLQILGSKPFEIDIFASDWNHRCENFFSYHPSKKALGHNAFAYDWSKYGYGYLCPPVNQIIGAIKHFIFCDSNGILVVPMWPSATFWPLLCSDGRHFNNCFTYVDSAFVNLRSGPFVTSNFFKGNTKFKMLFLMYDGSIQNPLSPRLSKSFCIFDGCQSCIK